MPFAPNSISVLITFWSTFIFCVCLHLPGFPGGAVVKNPPVTAGDAGLIPGSGRSPGGGNSNLLQYSWLGNPMDGGAWWGTVHGGHKESDTTECTHTHTHTLYLRSSSVRFWRGWFALQLCGRHCWGPKLRHFFPPPSRHHADYIQGSPLLHSVPWCLGHEESVNPDAVIPLINNWLPRCHGPILRSLRQEGNLLSSFRKRFPCF